ncbi:MAG TPA: hypothetical protein VF824_18055 [Thermoanaerobaculia bacterium]|jgi:hypothetical protein
MTDPNAFDLPYPVWTAVVPASESAATSVSVAGALARGGSTAAALSAVLGWRVREDDAAGIRRALAEAFPITRDVTGKTVVKWRPRGYRAQAVQAGIGAITGAQLSIYERARTIVDQTRTLLDELTGLLPAPDAEDVAAVRALIAPQLADLVDQFGSEGGPMPQRVDTIFSLLFGDDAQNKRFQDPDTVHGLFGLLRDRLGLVAARVNTIDEEKLLTKFHLVVNYVDMLLLSWNARRGAMEAEGDDVFFGTHVVRLQRVFSVVAESVAAIYRAMDSVFLGAAERLTLRLHTQPTITVAELLQWIEELASSRAFDILTEGGKDGAEHALVPILERVNRLYIAMTRDAPDFARYPDAFRTARVQSAVSELRTHLDTALRLARQIRRTPAAPLPGGGGGGGGEAPHKTPRIHLVGPLAPQQAGAMVTFEVVTRHVRDDAKFRLVHEHHADVAAEGVQRHGKHAFVKVRIPPVVSTGWHIAAGEARSPETFNIAAGSVAPVLPHITGIKPDTLEMGRDAELRISGEHFDVKRVQLVRDDRTIAADIKKHDDRHIEIAVTMPRVNHYERWHVEVINRDGGTATHPIKLAPPAQSQSKP